MRIGGRAYEVFQKRHGGAEQVTVLNNEFYITSPDGKQKEKITDSNFIIGSTCYHFECQSTSDGTMILRVFEYGSQIAIRESSVDENVLTVKFPNAAVLYLRQTRNTPDEITICIKVPRDSCNYQRVRERNCHSHVKEGLRSIDGKIYECQKGVTKIMGGQILDYEAKRIRDEERELADEEKRRAIENLFKNGVSYEVVRTSINSNIENARLNRSCGKGVSCVATPLAREDCAGRNLLYIKKA